MLIIASGRAKINNHKKELVPVAPLLEVKDLKTYFYSFDGIVKAIADEPTTAPDVTV
jgi:hypothetical protein